MAMCAKLRDYQLAIFSSVYVGCLHAYTHEDQKKVQKLFLSALYFSILLCACSILNFKKSNHVNIYQLYKKHQEAIAYIFFGVLTTAINYIVYFFCLVALSMHYAYSNFIAWLLAVIFAFITNKIYVFQSRNFDILTTFKEALKFTTARILSVIIETALLWIFIDLLFFDSRIIKIFTNIVVVVLNYLFSKYFIFNSKQ